jgi:hypothetical protein
MLDVRIWCDKKFRSLTPLKPSGQALFLYLLSNPHTTSIPGLYRAGAGAMAEELAWSLLGFQRALKEIVAQGLVKADLKARVIFIPNAIKYNKPQSPNVVRSWAVHWDEIPECALKNEAYFRLESFIKGLGKAFVLAFNETLRRCDMNDAKQVCTKSCFNQEQEQKQEQDQEQEQEEEKKQFPQVDLVKLMIKPMLVAKTEYLLTIPLENQAVYQIAPEELAEWQQTYNDIDVLNELHKLRSWNVANPNKRKHTQHILRHIHTWLSKAQQQKNQFSTSCHASSMTLDHNLYVTKKWLDVSLESDQYFPKSHGLLLVKGKKSL